MWVMHLSRAGACHFNPEMDTVFISITDPDSQEAELCSSMSNRVPIHRVQFDDCEHTTIGYTRMSWEQAQAMAKFILACRGRNIVVHCEAGISRSAAVAEAIAETFPEYKLVQGISYPNGHVKSLLKRALGNVPVGAEEVASD
jgi:predicted protein tyrosine phosphatase